MKVIDASVVIELVAYDLNPDRLGDEPLAAPHLIDCEVLNSLRGLELGAELTGDDASRARLTFEAMAIERYPVVPLRRRIWELRHNFTAYDATYVALAEALGVALITVDGRIARASGPRCEIEVV